MCPTRSLAAVWTEAGGARIRPEYRAGYSHSRLGSGQWWFMFSSSCRCGGKELDSGAVLKVR